MESLPTDFFALLTLVFLWGARHGFDADHLATVDGLTRYNARHNPRLARYCGSLFSLGHGGVVILVALTVSTLAEGWSVPNWLTHFGSWISIIFLLALAWLNLRAVALTPADQIVSPAAGLKGKLLLRFQRTAHPGMVAAVGALFALSFDTLSQAALFALTATRFGGPEYGLALGLAFTAGMLVCDGLNSVWIARLLRRADQTAIIASRIMGVSIAGVALTVAGFGLAKYVSPVVDAWAEGTELAFGLLLIVVVLSSFFVAMRIATYGLPAQGAR